MQFEGGFRQFSALNLKKHCQAKVNTIQKDKHVNFVVA